MLGVTSSAEGGMVAALFCSVPAADVFAAPVVFVVVVSSAAFFFLDRKMSKIDM
jgi:hypothetical protein